MNMKKIFIALLLTTLAISIQGQTFYGHAKIQISRGISLSETTWLDYGQITATAEGSITITPLGVVTIAGGISAKGATSPSVFSVLAMPTTAYTITPPVTCSLTSGTNLIYLTNFTSNLVGSNGVTDANGIGSISIGGKIFIPANFVYGSYSGGFPVVVSYQ